MLRAFPNLYQHGMATPWGNTLNQMQTPLDSYCTINKRESRKHTIDKYSIHTNTLHPAISVAFQTISRYLFMFF
jgi:hypothetical protein